MTKIKRTNIRFMTWVSLVTLCVTGLTVAFRGVSESSSQPIIAFMWILGGVVFAYIGATVTGDTFNAHSIRKHGGDK